MRKILSLGLFVIFALSLEASALAVPIGKNAKGFGHGIVITVDGTDYYLAGAPDGPGGATDIPRHYWVMASSHQLVGKHYNIGPFETANWWSSDAPDGALLYVVHAVIDTWGEE